MGVKDQARYVILVGRNKRVGDDLLKRWIAQRVLGCYTFLLKFGGKPG